jgi:RNA polymerase sigma factor (sigma-70 family)
MPNANAAEMQFETHRSHLLAVATRVLGSTSEAEDAVQETWLRLDRTGADGIENLGGWLTTVAGRICLDQLRARSTRRDDPIEDGMPEVGDQELTPEDLVVLTESTAEALAIVLDRLAPVERVAFVLHDVFDVPFDEIASIVDRTPIATRQLASRARRRVRSSAPDTDADRSAEREVVDAFLAAAREGDFNALLAVLDPNVVMRVDMGTITAGAVREVHGAEPVIRQAIAYSQLDLDVQHALINGNMGLISFSDRHPFSTLEFTISERQIVEIGIIADPERLHRLSLSVAESEPNRRIA